MAGEKAQKETFAIADDEIDIRLIQQQISNVLKRVSPNNSDSKSGSSKKENEPPPLLKSDSSSKPISKPKEEEKVEEKKPLPPTIDLFGGSTVAPIRKPTSDDEPEIVEILHPIPVEKLTPNQQKPEHTVKIPADEEVQNVDIKHNIPTEEMEQKNTLEHSVKIPQEEWVNNLPHSTPMEEVELVNNLPHSIPQEEAEQKITLEHSKPQMTINDIAQAEHSVRNLETPSDVTMPTINNIQQVPGAPSRSTKSTEDSMDINELMFAAEKDISIDFLNQLTNKINSEMGVQDVEMPKYMKKDEDEFYPTPSLPHTERIDESEANINTIAAQEEQMVEELINKENERTIVTEQICEYPVNNTDAGFIQALDYLDNDKHYKKYVVYIDEINQEFMDSLTIYERKDIINSILREQDEVRKARLQEERRRKLVTMLMFVIISVFVLVPLLFLLINKCMEATIMNYRRNQNNWEVLFKEHSKIKKTTTNSYY